MVSIGRGLYNTAVPSLELNQIRAEVARNMERILQAWQLSTVVNTEARIQRASVTDETISAQLVDGRTISVPLTWS